MKGLLTAATVAALAAGYARPAVAQAAPSGTTCESVASCEADCERGNTASCVRAGLFYRDGYGVTPDKARADAIFRRACDQKQHPRACLSHALLAENGWMFEVERDGTTYASYLELARTSGHRRCRADDADACMVLVELESEVFDGTGWPPAKPTDDDGRAARATVDTILDAAEKACQLGHGTACQWLLDNADDMVRRGYIVESSSRRVRTRDSMKKLAETSFAPACKKGDNYGCFKSSLALIVDADDGDPAAAEQAWKRATTLAGPACKRGHADSCLVVSVADLFVVLMPILGGGGEPDAGQLTTVRKAGARMASELETTCGRVRSEDGRAACDDIVEMVAEGTEDAFGFDKPNPAYARKVYGVGCRHGNLEMCGKLAQLITDGDKRPDAGDRALLLKLSERVCRLSPAGERCDLCLPADKSELGVSAPKSRLCRMRLAWEIRNECASNEDRCAVLGHMYQRGDGVGPDVDAAASYFRIACDAGLKSSCATLDEICRSSTELAGDPRCQQSLIHSDVFYEAEWQYRKTGIAGILGEKEGEPSGKVGAVSVAGGGSGGGIALERASLDTDLVVSIVLDRARQAAIRLVVSELRRATRGKRVPIYLDDLLSQAALLLADQSSMRREKFQDLAMTVVRAFVASNLVKTLYSTDAELLAAAHWAAWAADAEVDWKPAELSGREIELLRGYLTDWAYYLLGETPLFSRATGDKTAAPACPFRRDPARGICTLITVDGGQPNKTRLARALRVEAMLQGLSLAKALREEGSIDLRRFIESIARSQTIANLTSTPGLDLAEWKKKLAELTETQLRDLDAQIDAVRAVLTASGWRALSTTGHQLGQTRQRALAIVGEASPYLALFDPENVRVARSILALVATAELRLVAFEKARAELNKGGGLIGGDGDAARAARQKAVDEARAAWSEAAREVAAALDGWRDASAFLDKIEPKKDSITKARKVITELRSSVIEIETTLRRYKPPRPEGMDITIELEPSFEIAHVPLDSLTDLKDQFKSVAKSLVALDKSLGEVFPGMPRKELKSAIRAVVRLLGFFDLMERVARTARLNQTCGDVIEALRLLGSVRGKEFTAPLFDVIDPVLHAVKTHEPMDVDLLFSVISKVRLDSLLTNLAAEGSKLCADGEGVECWTFKVVHSLQEAIQRDGDAIRIDGGAFAKRLASHGDDYRRKHKWRGYFHLTVGLGGLYSNDPPVVGDERMSGDNRLVPLIGEQIGFGWASPTFYDDTFTFKFGAYGSGILYRAALDSSESNAIMASPFIALDLYDLVELYAGPMLLFYPPVGDKDAAIRFGFSAGLTVPLNAYLEKL